MTRNEFESNLKDFVRGYILEKAEDYKDKSFDYIFDDVMENIINDPLCDAVEMGMDDIENLPSDDYDYCDAHEEQWKIDGKWGCKWD